MSTEEIERAIGRIEEALEVIRRTTGLVEVEVMVGEEPEVGVEFAVTSNPAHVEPRLLDWRLTAAQQSNLVHEFVNRFIATDPGEIVELP
jgi:hypothetical protein